MIRQAIRSVVLVVLALLTLATPTWTFSGESHVRFGSQHGIIVFGFGHSVHPHPFHHHKFVHCYHFFPPHHHRGFLVLGFQKVWVPGPWIVLDPYP